MRHLRRLLGVLVAPVLLIPGPHVVAQAKPCLSYNNASTTGYYHRPVGAGSLNWMTTLAFVPPCAEPSKGT